ncbi:IS66 family transposase, partial [Malikia spinosa]
MLSPESLSELSAEQMREMLGRLMGDLRHKQAIIDKLTHENAVLKRLKFAAQSERFSPEQRSLLEESLDADLQAVAEELEALAPPTPEGQVKQQPKRRLLPAHLPRREIHHDPESTTCACGCQMKRIGEDVSEKLDYVPGTFTVERHIRGKWACAQCETIVQAP